MVLTLLCVLRVFARENFFSDTLPSANNPLSLRAKREQLWPCCKLLSGIVLNIHFIDNGHAYRGQYKGHMDNDIPH